jgi:hypothetical protein
MSRIINYMAFSIKGCLATSTVGGIAPGVITAATFASPTALKQIVIGSITGKYTTFDVTRTGGTEGTFTDPGKTGTSYTDPTTNLTNNTQYTYTILPINAGSKGTVFTAITNPNNSGTPGKIYTLADANNTSAGQRYALGGSNKVAVGWQTGVYSKIFLANTTKGGPTFDATAKNGQYVSDGSSKDSAADLSPNTQYTYTLTCENGDGIKVANVGEATYAPFTWGVCNTPTTSSPGDRSVTITCTGTFSKCKFEYSGGTGGTPGSGTTIVGTDSASQTYTNLDYNATYSFYCSPVNGANYVSNNTSTAVTFTTLSTPAKPSSAPTVSVAVGGTTITVTLTAVAGATSYTVTNDTVTNSGTTLTAQTITTTSATFTGVAGYGYTFKYTATNAAGTSAASDSSTSITPNPVVGTLLYKVVTGTKSLVGTSGMTQKVNSLVDDGSIAITGLPFNVKMYGISSSSIAIGSNFYIEIGSSIMSNVFSVSLTSPNPGGAPYLHLGSRDSQYTNVYYLEGKTYFRVRLEGNADWRVSSIGSIYEITFFKQINSSDDIYIEFVTGAYGNSDGVWGMTNGISGGVISTAFAGSAALAANSSYVLILDSTGAYKSITSGQYIDNSPTAISGCQLWLDANDYNSLTLSGSNVTQWNDKSGNSRHATSYNGTCTYNSTGFNSRPTIVFDSTSLYSPMASGTITTGISVFCVFYCTGTPSYTAPFTRTGTVVTNHPDPIDIYNANRLSGQENNVRSATSTLNLSTVTTASLYNITVKTGSWIDYLNGTSSWSSTFVDTFGDDANAKYFYIGSRADKVTSFIGRMSELLVYNSFLSDADRQKIEGYLAWKWGLQANLPSSHPYYSGAP